MLTGLLEPTGGGGTVCGCDIRDPKLRAQVGVLPDRRVWMDLVSRSGDTSCDLDVGNGEGSGAPDVRIEAKSVSGDIRVRRSTARA